MREILWAAQHEAAEWDLRTVKLWDPGYLLPDIVKRTGVQRRRVEREGENITSLMWFGEGSGKGKIFRTWQDHLQSFSQSSSPRAKPE
ncbi:MAG: hypothetical protein Q9198_004209 [Flavoplaca austrocitrina]